MSDVLHDILALERAALDRWGNGDPDGFLEIADDDVSYFDPFQQKRVDGHPALAALYENYRGKVLIEQDEIVGPRVQLVGDAAILTFDFVSKGSEGSAKWHATEVYRRADESWRIVHTHWSLLHLGEPAS